MVTNSFYFIYNSSPQRRRVWIHQQIFLTGN